MHEKPLHLFRSSKQPAINPSFASFITSPKHSKAAKHPLRLTYRPTSLSLLTDGFEFIRMDKRPSSLLTIKQSKALHASTFDISLTHAPKRDFPQRHKTRKRLNFRRRIKTCRFRLLQRHIQ